MPQPRGQIRKIDPNSGLHDLTAGEFAFQLRYMKDQCEQILACFDDLLRNSPSLFKRDELKTH